MDKIQELLDKIKEAPPYDDLDELDDDEFERYEDAWWDWDDLEDIFGEDDEE